MSNRGGARKGAGRPRKEQATEVLHIRVMKTTADIMRRHAEFTNCSLSELAATSIMYGEAKAYLYMLDKLNTKINKKQKK